MNKQGEKVSKKKKKKKPEGNLSEKNRGGCGKMVPTKCDEKKMVKEIGTKKKYREYYFGLKQVGCTAKFEENRRLLKYKRRRSDANPSLLSCQMSRGNPFFSDINLELHVQGSSCQSTGWNHPHFLRIPVAKRVFHPESFSSKTVPCLELLLRLKHNPYLKS